MLEINPSLTPALVKALLMYTSQPIPEVSYYEQGAGMVNAPGAVLLSALVAPDADQLYRDWTTAGRSYEVPLLAGGFDGLTQETNIAGETCSWNPSLIFADGIFFVDDPLGSKGIFFVDRVAFFVWEGI